MYPKHATVGGRVIMVTPMHIMIRPGEKQQPGSVCSVVMLLFLAISLSPGRLGFLLSTTFIYIILFQSAVRVLNLLLDHSRIVQRNADSAGVRRSIGFAVPNSSTLIRQSIEA